MMITQEDRRKYLIRYLLDERPDGRNLNIPPDETEQKQLLRGLLNIRMPEPVSPEFVQIQDAYLKDEIRSKGITDCRTLVPAEDGIYLWRGDITTLRCDAIVNAANSRMLGCFCPCHGCVDNAIHTFSGVQLRSACAEMMRKQGYEEPTGSARITPAFNLPSQYVIHTVGPVVSSGGLSKQHEELLISCYRSCLLLAVEHGLSNIAFCCISTGEFSFPPERAAKLAVQTVRSFRAEHKNQIEVIFNVFRKDDYNIYRKLLGADR